MTQQTMAKEQILGNYYREHTDTETAIYEAMERYKEQEVAKEREKYDELNAKYNLAINEINVLRHKIEYWPK